MFYVWTHNIEWSLNTPYPPPPNEKKIQSFLHGSFGHSIFQFTLNESLFWGFLKEDLFYFSLHNFSKIYKIENHASADIPSHYFRCKILSHFLARREANSGHEIEICPCHQILAWGSDYDGTKPFMKWIPVGTKIGLVSKNIDFMIKLLKNYKAFCDQPYNLISFYPTIFDALTQQ